ncbi:MAG: permease prefix domain 1-containing protein [Oscillospiraceae bacterium]|nr:permease prefix domain 1-containing protein [Oscillospiraceae bacterium]
MDAINTYIENIFAAFPQTRVVLALKRGMHSEMEEKYQLLIAEGKSEHEAVGFVISDFGSIDEIAAELGFSLGASDSSHTKSTESKDSIRLSEEDAFTYLEQSRKGSTWIGLGVWLILTGIALILVVSGLGRAITGAGSETVDAVAIVVMLLAIAGAVPIFIVHGMRLRRFEHYDDHDILLDAQTVAKAESMAAKCYAQFPIYLSLGIALILVSLGVFIILGTMGYRSFPLALFLFMIGFSVFLFVKSGMTKSSFDVILGKGDYAKKEKTTFSEKIMGTISVIYWPLIVAAYLLWSFVGDAWTTSWIIWPVAGVLFTAIAGGISTWHSSRRK